MTGTEGSPIWDGSATSMSGNGAPVSGKGDIIITANDLPPVILPSGSGGGCVTSGPFKNMSVNLGPIFLPIPGGGTESNPNGPFAFNPRCLKRDLTDAINSQFATAPRIVDLILRRKTVEDFQMTMQGIPGSGDIGVHGGGHFTIGKSGVRDQFFYM
jgi:tyrosinase